MPRHPSRNKKKLRAQALSEQWLDDQRGPDRLERRSQHRLKKSMEKEKKSHGARALDFEMANATAVEIFPKRCRVRLDSDGCEILCTLRRAGLYQVDVAVRHRAPLAVGDRVLVTRSGVADGVVEGVCERKTQILRPTPGQEGSENKIQILVTNVELLAIVASCCHPPFSAGLVDRFLIAAERGRIQPILVINKMDLQAEASLQPWSLYRDLGVRVVEVSSVRGDGLEDLRSLLSKKKVAFVGHSGVGKTSLLRALLKVEIGKIGAMSGATGKGRHTTSSATVMPLSTGEGGWIDTPGVREFGLVGIGVKTLCHYFPEFAALPCSASGCLHLLEDGCSAQVLPRYGSYLRILHSLAGDR